MEVFSLVAAAFVVVIATAIFAGLKSSSSDKGKKLPPGSFGWPVIGETVEFLYGKHEKFVLDRMRKYSPDVFKTMINGEKTAVICGPKGHRFLFTNEPRLFVAFRPYVMMKLLHTCEPDEVSRKEETRVVQSPLYLKVEALSRYMEEMDMLTQRHMKDAWEGRDMVNAFQLTKTLALTLASRFFLGVENPERVARLFPCFDAIGFGMHAFAVDLPWTTYGKARRGVAVVRKEMMAIIQEKKKAMASGAPMHDILAHMMNSKDVFGNYLSEEDIAGNCIGLLLAGYSSASIAMAYFFKYVGENPGVYDRVLAEQTELADGKKEGEFLSREDVHKMNYSWNVINEVIRLTPPLQGSYREALTDITYAGYTIPKGWKVYWTVSTTNRNPEYFPDPDKFDPSRHDEGNAFQIPQSAFVPFGGGPRLCPGKEYARLAILTFVHHVVKRFKWQVLFPEEKTLGNLTSIPQKGVPIRLYRR